MNQKIFFQLLLTIICTYSIQAQTWSYVFAPGTGVNGTDTWQANNCDLQVISDSEIYTAAAYINAFGGNKRIEIYHYNGTNWAKLPDPSTGEDIGNVFVRKCNNSSDLYIAYAKLSFSPYGYFVTVKKYDGNTWTPISTTLPLPSGGSFFAFELDHNDAPVVIGSATYSTQNSNVHRLESGNWVAYPIPNSSGSVFSYNSSFVDTTGNVIFLWSKAASASVQYFHIDTLAGNTLYTTPENVSIAPFSTVYLANSATDFVVYNTASGGTGITNFRVYENIGGNWSASPVDSLASNGIAPVGRSPYGVNFVGQNTPSGSKLYTTHDLYNPVYVPSVVTGIFRIKFSSNYAYCLVNNGVVYEDISNITTNTLNIPTIKSNYTIYPNPSTGIFTIQFENQNNTTIEIFNTVGERILWEQSNESQHQINLEPFAAGIYFIKINGQTAKIIKS